MLWGYSPDITCTSMYNQHNYPLYTDLSQSDPDNAQLKVTLNVTLLIYSSIP